MISIGANIFFLDETGFRCNMTLRRGYGWKGLPIIKQKSGIRGKNQTLMLLAQISDSVEKIIHWDMIEGGMKTDDFHEFLTEFNPPNNGKKNVVIMDNLPVHKADKIIELLASKNVEVIFLPSYTPELNPIEKKNHLLKRDVRKEEVRTKERLFSIIKERIKFFKEENTVKYLENSVKECLMKLNATTPIENKKYFWDTERWHSMCSGSRYFSIIVRTFRLQDMQFS